MNFFQRSPISSAKSYDQFYKANRLPVFRYIYGLTGGPQEEVEDLTAEAFLRAWKSRHSFTGDENHATGWVIRIAKRLVIDEYRRHQTELAHSPVLPSIAENQPEQATQLKEAYQHLLALLTGLPDTQREILVLRYMLGWRVNEIALQTGASENSISVTIHRALGQLRERWQDQEPDEQPISFPIKEQIS